MCREQVFYSKKASHLMACLFLCLGGQVCNFFSEIDKRMLNQTTLASERRAGFAALFSAKENTSCGCFLTSIRFSASCFIPIPACITWLLLAFRSCWGRYFVVRS